MHELFRGFGYNRLQDLQRLGEVLEMHRAFPAPIAGAITVSGTERAAPAPRNNRLERRRTRSWYSWLTISS